jgi:hypothetical protein
VTCGSRARCISPAGAGPVRVAARRPWPEAGRGGLCTRPGPAGYFRSFTICAALTAPPSLCLVVPHQIVQRPVEVLSPRGISMSLTEVLATYRLDQLLAIEWRPRYLRPLRPAWAQCGMDGRRGPIVQPVKNDDYRCR